MACCTVSLAKVMTTVAWLAAAYSATYFAGASPACLQPLIGYFVNTAAVRAVLEDDDTFETLVKRVSTSQAGWLLSLQPLQIWGVGCCSASCHEQHSGRISLAHWPLPSCPGCSHTVALFPYAFDFRLVQVDALQNAALPFADVVSAVGAKRARGINPIFQASIR
jgi:hypothetical protein